MIKQYLRLTALLIVVSAAIFIFAACDKDCPVCPPTETISDYNFYVSGIYTRAAYAYNTRLKTITDTIPLQGSYYITDIAVSGDGRRLLVYSSPSTQTLQTTLAVIDVATDDTVKVLSGLLTDYLMGGIEVSNTGKYIAVYDGHNIHFLDGTTFEVLFSDTLDVHSGRFTPDDSRFYCEWMSSSYGIYDMVAESLVSVIEYFDESGNSPRIWGLQPTLNEEKLYLFVRYSAYSNWLVSYRPAVDSNGLRWFIGPPRGDLRISPDGKTILASDPGSVYEEILGSEMVFAIDPLNDGVNYISPGYCVTDSGLWYILAGDLAITPDSRYVGIADERGQGFALMDLKTQRYVDVQYRRKVGAMFDLIACQKRRK